MSNYRASKVYKTMTSYMATGLAEGFEEGSEYEQMAAWQWLYDHKMYRVLQGWFGRSMEALLNAGEIRK
jgi:hypothetical protein